MIAKHLLIWPDEQLAERSERVEDLEFAGAIGGEMLDLMYGAGTRALAAVQVGVLQRIVVLDCGWEDGQSVELVCINPYICTRSDIWNETEESAVSVPGVLAQVKRPARIELAFIDIEGLAQVEEFDGPDAALVQQVMDHLDGLTLLDHLAAEARAALLAEYEVVV